MLWIRRLWQKVDLLTLLLTCPRLSAANLYDFSTETFRLRKKDVEPNLRGKMDPGMPNHPVMLRGDLLVRLTKLGHWIGNPPPWDAPLARGAAISINSSGVSTGLLACSTADGALAHLVRSAKI